MCQNHCIPVHRKHFFKFWRSQELDSLKDSAIDSDKPWKAAVFPTSGLLLCTIDALLLNVRIAQPFMHANHQDSDIYFTKDLHDRPA